MQIITDEQIEAGKSPRGGWTRKMLAAWGVPWSQVGTVTDLTERASLAVEGGHAGASTSRAVPDTPGARTRLYGVFNRAYPRGRMTLTAKQVRFYRETYLQ